MSSKPKSSYLSTYETQFKQFLVQNDTWSDYESHAKFSWTLSLLAVLEPIYIIIH